MVKYILIISGSLLSYIGMQAQSVLPWELERFDLDAYPSGEIDLSSSYDEPELFAEYYKAYKQQRTENPADYFPTPTSYQNSLKAKLQNSNSPEDLLLLVNFLEKGSVDALNELANHPYEHVSTLPYRFISAMVNNDVTKAQFFLDKMNEKEMISPVLKSWGMNAISNGKQESFITNGIQDLIGLSWALSKTKRLQNATLFNHYVNSISGVYTSEVDFLAEFPFSWISPTYKGDFLESQMEHLSISGIGFKWKSSSDQALFEFRMAAAGFKGLGVECQNPADAGLVRSYTYFLDQMKVLMKNQDKEDFQALYNELETYIEKTIRNK